VSAHDEMYLVRCRVDLIEQTLEVDRAAGASRGDDEFHYTIQNHRTRSHSRSDWQSTRFSSRDVPAEELPHLFGDDRDVHRSALRQPVVGAVAEAGDFALRVNHRLLRKCADHAGSAEADRDGACGNFAGANCPHHVASAAGTDEGIFGQHNEEIFSPARI